MTVREAYALGVTTLRSAPVPTESPELDARVLLGHLLGTDLTGLLGRYPEGFPEAQQAAWAGLLAERARGVPVAWLVGHQEFMGLDFVVGPGVLVPRADTETLVEAALELLGPLVASHTGTDPVRVADACTGSGCVGISIAALTPSRLRLRVTATDLSGEALGYAFRNAQRLLPTGPSVEFLAVDLLAGIEGPVDLIVSNPPYLTAEETRQRVENLGWSEPALALDGGPDGLDLIRCLVAQASDLLVPGGWLLIEAADAQMDAMATIYRDHGLDHLREWKDLAGQRRVLGGRLRGL